MIEQPDSEKPCLDGMGMRKFDTGATRNEVTGRIDPEGFFSPLVFQRYCEYMNKHRKQADGVLRDSDNWQKGIPIDQYMKSKWRHFLTTWQIHRNWFTHEDIQESLCAELFNTMGMLHEILKDELEIQGLLSKTFGDKDE